MFLVRGYQEDSTDSHKPGTVFDVTLPVWRVGEVLLHASRLGTTLYSGDAGEAEVHVRIGWRGLAGRELVAWAEPLILLEEGRRCRQEEVRSELVAPVSAVPDQLPELVARLTLPLYEAFDFFRPSMQMYQEQLARMRSSRG
jgi:hypothetical protein